MARNQKAPGAFTNAFRAWVQDSLATLGTSAAALARDLDLGQNTIAQFLSDPARDIRLTTAHDITCKLRGMAADQGAPLPALEVSFNG